MNAGLIVVAMVSLLSIVSGQASADGGPFVRSAWANVLDPSQPLLYVPDNENSIVDVFPAAVRAPKLRFAIPSGVPNAICVDAHGNVYVIDENTLIISEFARGKTSPLRSITTPAGFYYPSSLGVGADGSIYILEENAQNAAPVVNQIDRTGKLLRSMPLGTDGYGSFTLDSSGTLYVSSYTSVLVFAPGATKPMRTLPQANLAGGLAIDSEHHLIVGLPYTNRVVIELLPSGKVIRSIPTIGAGDFLALDEADDYLYAVSASGRTLQWYDFQTGRPLGFMSGPYTQVAVDPGKR